MELLRPWALLLLPLALVPLLWRHRRSALRYSSFVVLPGDRLSLALERVERGLGVAFVVAATLGIAEPRTPVGVATGWGEGAKLIFVLDQSASMFSPWSGSREGVTKITAAREAIRELATRRRGDRMALIGFGKSPVVYATLAADRDRFLRALGLLHADLGDTVIDTALLRALGLLEAAGEGAGSRVVILLSDGAGRLSGPVELANRFLAAGVSLHWLVVEGGRDASEGMGTLMSVLGSQGRHFRLGEVSELPAALEAVARLESKPMRVQRTEGGRRVSGAARWLAVGCLLGLGAFAIGGGPRSRRPERAT